MDTKYYKRMFTLEGIDKTGKSSIEDAVVKMTGGMCMGRSRSFMSMIVYSRLYEREIDESFFVTMMQKHHNLGEAFFLLRADKDDVIRRMMECDEKHITEDQIYRHQEMFFMVCGELKACGIEINIIDTSNLSIEKTGQKIIDVLMTQPKQKNIVHIR